MIIEAGQINDHASGRGLNFLTGARRLSSTSQVNISTVIVSLNIQIVGQLQNLISNVVFF